MIDKSFDIAGGTCIKATVLTDSTGNEFTTANPLNVQSPDVAVSGSITTQNLNATGAATAGSAVNMLNLNDTSTVTIQVVGTYTGALTPQVSMNGVNWVALGSTCLINVNNGLYFGAIPTATQSVFQVDTAGFTHFRLVALGAQTGTASVYMRSTQATGMLALDNPLPSGGNTIGGVVLAGGTNTVGNIYLNASSGTGGTSASHTTSAATTNATVLKAAAGRVYGVSMVNTAAADRFVKLFNKASAPVLGTDVPVKTFKVAANSSNAWAVALGSSFSLGIAFAITAAATDSDATAISVGDVILDIDYV